MFWHRNIALAAVAALSISSSALAYEFGRTATPEEIKLWDIDVRPDGKGLPEGSGAVAQGKSVYTDNCAACYGVNGQGGIKDRLVGGQGTLASDKPIKTDRKLLALRHHGFRLHTSRDALPGAGIAQRRRLLRAHGVHPELERNSAAGRQARQGDAAKGEDAQSRRLHSRSGVQQSAGAEVIGIGFGHDEPSMPAKRRWAQKGPALFGPLRTAGIVPALALSVTVGAKAMDRDGLITIQSRYEPKETMQRLGLLIAKLYAIAIPVA
jgi:hypothetical protein